MSEAPAPLDLDRLGEDVPLLEGIRTARAIRRLRPDPVPFALIRKVCEAARDPSFPEALRRNMRAALHLSEHLHEAPVHLFVAGWKRRGEPQLQALYPCVQNVLLACRALGLGASLTTVHRTYGEGIDAWLGLPTNCPTCALIPIGWPLGRHGRPPRRPVDACLHQERFPAEELARPRHTEA